MKLVLRVAALSVFSMVLAFNATAEEAAKVAEKVVAKPVATAKVEPSAVAKTTAPVKAESKTVVQKAMPAQAATKTVAAEAVVAQTIAKPAIAQATPTKVEPKPEPKKEETEKEDPAVTAKKAEILRTVKALQAPGNWHANLGLLEGLWTYASKSKLTEDTKPEKAEGTCESAKVFGDRFLRMTLKGKMMGEDYQSVCFLGYDNLREAYVMSWIDNMNTGLMTFSGNFDAVKKTFSLSGNNSYPFTGEKMRSMRWEWIVLDEKNLSLVSYANGRDGKEYKSREIQFTRI